MESTKYLLIGGGVASAEAIKQIRRIDEPIAAEVTRLRRKRRAAHPQIDECPAPDTGRRDEVLNAVAVDVGDLDARQGPFELDDHSAAKRSVPGTRKD